MLADQPDVAGWSDTFNDGLTMWSVLSGVSDINYAEWAWDAGYGPLNAFWIDYFYSNGITVIAVWNTTPDPSAYSEAANLGVLILDSMNLTLLGNELEELGSGGVQANDFNPDGNPMTSVLNSPPADGSVTLNPNGSFSYTPNAGFYGLDAFTYYDENGNGPTPMWRRCLSPSTPTPVANNDSYSAIAGQELDVTAVNGLYANDSNADGEPAHPGARLPGPSDGGLTLNPDGSFS